LAAVYAYKQKAHGTFLLQLFVAALLVRMLVAVAIFGFHGQDFFGGDAITYDFFGNAQMLGWAGDNISRLLPISLCAAVKARVGEWFTWLPLSTEPLAQHARSAADGFGFGSGHRGSNFLMCPTRLSQF